MECNELVCTKLAQQNGTLATNLNWPRRHFRIHLLVDATKN